MPTSSIVFAGIAPHPPIMVPEVGREAIAEVRGSIEAMRELTRRVVASGAETIVIVSPHAPLEARAFVAYQDEKLYGDFANFRAPETKIEVPLDKDLLAAISREAALQDYQVVGINGHLMDHGTIVPLYFLLDNGWQGRVVALGYSFLSDEHHMRFGACIKRAADSLKRPIAFIASGDLSHRLKPDAPAGYWPEAHLFDDEVVGSLRDCAPVRILEIDPDLRKRAGECGYRSILIALGLARELEPRCEVLSYEAPFGVGYMVAQLAGEESTKADASNREQRTKEKQAAATGDELPALARQTVETYVRDGRLIDNSDAPSSELLDQRAACFVTLKTTDGDLRGCIGTITPTKPTLAEELIANAINAATRDPRFPPVQPEELVHLRYSVDVLLPPEPARLEDLDPRIYGVIVEDETGLHRGLLLPNIEGVETVNKQVEIAARKAGILPGTPLRLQRFLVKRYPESSH